MITKEQFLDDTTEAELFGVLHEFIEKYNELLHEGRKEPVIILDKDIGLIAEHIITNIKSQAWL